MRIKSNDSHLSHILWIDRSVSVSVKNIVLGFHFVVLLLGTPYACKPKWNIMRTKICCIEPSSIFSPFIESSWGQVVNPLFWWMHTLDDSNSIMKKGELECCRRPDWFLQVLQIAQWALQRVSGKTCFCFTQNEETGEFSLHHSALTIAYKGKSTYLFLQKHVISILTQNTQCSLKYI